MFAVHSQSLLIAQSDTNQRNRPLPDTTTSLTSPHGSCSHSHPWAAESFNRLQLHRRPTMSLQSSIGHQVITCRRETFMIAGAYASALGAPATSFLPLRRPAALHRREPNRPPQPPGRERWLTCAQRSRVASRCARAHRCAARWSSHLSQASRYSLPPLATVPRR